MTKLKLVFTLMKAFLNLVPTMQYIKRLAEELRASRTWDTKPRMMIHAGNPPRSVSLQLKICKSEKIATKQMLDDLNIPDMQQRMTYIKMLIYVPFDFTLC